VKQFFSSFRFLVGLWAVIVVVWLFALYYNLFFLIWWFDIPLHFLGGVWACLFVRYVYVRCGLELQGNGNKIALFVFFVSSVMLIGVAWEFYEFIFDRYIYLAGYTRLAGVYENTLKDLFFDFIGAVVGYFISNHKV